MAKLRKILGAVSAVALVSTALTAPVRAEDEAPKFGYSITLSVLSDYLFRGISLTNNKPQVNPYIELTYGIGYVGFWISNVGDSTDLNFSSLGPVEIDYYAGIRPTFATLNWDIAALGYTFESRAPGFSLEDVSYVEFQVKASKEVVTGLTVGGAGFITPDQGVNYPFSFTFEGTALYALPKIGIFDPVVSGLIGYTRFESSPFHSGTPDAEANLANGVFLGEQDYLYWNAGIKLNVDRWFMDFRYADTNIGDFGLTKENGLPASGLADSRFLFTAGFFLSGP